jgi:hypothetical protein
MYSRRALRLSLSWASLIQSRRLILYSYNIYVCLNVSSLVDLRKNCYISLFRPVFAACFAHLNPLHFMMAFLQERNSRAAASRNIPQPCCLSYNVLFSISLSKSHVPPCTDFLLFLHPAFPQGTQEITGNKGKTLHSTRRNALTSHSHVFRL